MHAFMIYGLDIFKTTSMEIMELWKEEYAKLVIETLAEMLHTQELILSFVNRVKINELVHV